MPIAVTGQSRGGHEAVTRRSRSAPDGGAGEDGVGGVGHADLDVARPPEGREARDRHAPLPAEAVVFIIIIINDQK